MRQRVIHSDRPTLILGVKDSSQLAIDEDAKLGDDVRPRLTLPLGVAEDIRGWQSRTAHGLTSRRIPILLFDHFVEEEQDLTFDDILCIELTRDPVTDRGYAWITTVTEPLSPPFERLIQREQDNGARLMKYCPSRNGNFKFLTFDQDPDADIAELVSLEQGLMRLTARGSEVENEYSLLAEAPQMTIIVRDYKAFEMTDLLVVGFDGREFFGVRRKPDTTIEICKQTEDALTEDFDAKILSSVWEPFINIDFAAAQLEGFTRPYEHQGTIGGHLTVYDPKTKALHLCDLTVVPTEGSRAYAEAHWSVKPGVVFREQTVDGHVIAWVRVGTQELRVMPLQAFFFL